MANIPVVFTFDKRILPAASIAIKSLIDSAKSSTKYDIRILHNDLSLKNQKNLTSLIEKTNHSIGFHYVNKKLFKGVRTNNKSWSEIVYYRMIIPQILIEYDKVIYSDVDVFFKDDLEEVYNTSLENFEWGGVRAEKNTKNSTGHKFFEENKNEFIFWSGFMLINCEKQRQENTFQKLLKTSFDFKDRLTLFDLDVLNITCDKIKEIPLNYCVLETLYENERVKEIPEYSFLKNVYSIEELKEARKNPKIIHYAGKLGKPWRRKNPPEYYKKYMENLPPELKKYTLRDYRKKLFSKN